MKDHVTYFTEYVPVFEVLSTSRLKHTHWSKVHERSSLLFRFSRHALSILSQVIGDVNAKMVAGKGSRTPALLFAMDEAVEQAAAKKSSVSSFVSATASVSRQQRFVTVPTLTLTKIIDCYGSLHSPAFKVHFAHSHTDAVLCA